MRTLKIFLTVLIIAFTSQFSYGQTQSTLPAGSTSYSGNLFLDPDGNIWTGRTGSYTNLGSWEKVTEAMPDTWTPAQIDSAITANISTLSAKASNFIITSNTTLNWTSDMAFDEMGNSTSETWAQRYGNSINILRLYNDGGVWRDQSAQVSVLFSGQDIQTVTFGSVIGQNRITITGKGSSAPVGIFTNRGDWVAGIYSRGDYVSAPSRGDPNEVSLYFLIGSENYNSTTSPTTDISKWSEVPAAAGPAGPPGEQGIQGPAGQGLAPGGTAGQILSKVDGTDYNTQWISLPTSSVTSVGLTAPTGFSVSNSPITSSGNLGLSYASGYQGYTTAEANKLAGIAAGAQVNVPTNLAQGTRTSTTVPITSSTGSSATLSAATTSLAGVMSAADKAKLDGIPSGGGGGGGTVSSVAMTVPTGLSISGSPITSSGTLAVGLQSGYSIPTTANQTNWSTAYGWGDHSGLYRPISWVPSWTDVTGKPSTFAPSAHTHNASDINAGVLNIARIPTGTTSSTVAIGNDSRINNGQTAFGWGNHASAGYLTSVVGSDLGITGTNSSTFLPVWNGTTQEWVPGFFITANNASNNSVVQRTSTGQGKFADAVNANEAVTLGQADARYLRYSSVISVTANRTVALTDENTYWVVTGTRTLTIPTNTTVAFPIGGRIDVQVSASATANINGASGVTLTHKDGTGNTSRSGFIVFTLIKTAANAWTVVGG